MTQSYSRVLPDIIASGNHTTDGARCWEVRHANFARQAYTMKWRLLNEAMM
jgi:hypothetical protein